METVLDESVRHPIEPDDDFQAAVAVSATHMSYKTGILPAGETAINCINRTGCV